MMELLKRFEEDSLDDSELINELANDEEDEDFASRFGDLDLGKQYFTPQMVPTTSNFEYSITRKYIA